MPRSTCTTGRRSAQRSPSTTEPPATGYRDRVTPDPFAAHADGTNAAPVPAIALDAGQTGIKARTTGTPRDAVHPGIRTDAPLLPQLAAVVRAELERTDVAVEVVAAGVSGLTDAEADPDALRRL